MNSLSKTYCLLHNIDAPQNHTIGESQEQSTLAAQQCQFGNFAVRGGSGGGCERGGRNNDRIGGGFGGRASDQVGESDVICHYSKEKVTRSLLIEN